MNEPKPGRTRLQAPPIPREDPTPQLVRPEADPRNILEQAQGRRTLKVTWGEENYHPVAYNGFKVGGLELVVDVAPNQTIEEAYELAYGRLEKIVERQFETKLEGFINRLRKAGQAVKVSASSAKG